MGNEESSPKVHNSGDKDTTIINTQEFHTELHVDHSKKLWYITILLTIQMVIVAYKIIQKNVKKRTLERVSKSVGSVEHV